jgi:DNA polymerase (family 10)
VDLDAILEMAAQTGTALEVNSIPNRLDLDDVHVRRARELGVKLAINSDAHHPGALDNLPYGLGTARRGWAECHDVLNTRSWDEIRSWREARIVRAVD